MDNSSLMALFAPPSLDKIKKILCIQPHADDNEIGMGGIIADMTKRGVTVDYLTVTDGSLGKTGLSYEGKLEDTRRKEAEDAGRHLGVSSFFFLGHKDGTLSDVPSLSREIAEILRRGRYDAVAAPDPWNTYEAHFDHVVTGRAAASAAISVSLMEYPEGTDTLPLSLHAVLFYFTQKPNTFVDISGEFGRKMEAVSLHKSQISPETLELYTNYFAYRGMKMSGDQRIMEGVKALLPLHLHCTPEGGDI
ncbi:MAG: PIG-L deacetylase family protein [Candidatus Ornithospirochaeta sp.]